MISATRLFSVACATAILPMVACSTTAPTRPADSAPAAGPQESSDPSREVDALAEEYVHAYYREFPEEAFVNGYPDAPQDRFADRSATALAAWRARENAWLARFEAIDAKRLAGSSAVTHAYVLEQLRASVGVRVCRLELWNVSAAFSSWQSMVAETLANQTVATSEERARTIARVRDVARAAATEIANLEAGLAAGFTAAGSNVDAAIAQLDELLATPTPDSPLFGPATRDESGELAKSLPPIIEGEVVPAIRRYRDFLRDVYRARAREAAGVSGNPDGGACYAATVRYWTSLPLTAEELHRDGERQIALLESGMREIARTSFGTEDLPALLARVRSEPEFTFRTEQEILDFLAAAIARAEAACPRWFGVVPKASVVVRPYPAFQQATGGGSYLSGLPGQPGIYQIGTYEPAKLPRAGLEATTFHETWPGHHLQGAIALERPDLHPALRYFWNSGMGEGWALYTEQLADEMGLYSGPLDRLGMYSNQSMRAARLVVDSGIHALGWSRQRAIDYMLAHTALSEGGAAAQIDRYMAVPGQATAYMTGSLEILRLRALARERLGDRFDIRRFHDHLLEDGTVTLGMLAAKMEAWIAAGGK